jgi:Glycosyltransferases, probably involved in cell wall biogenesis
MDYPKNKFKVHICDDGRRSQLRELCEEHNISYITRNDNKGAKAGNLNNALNKVEGELFAVLDADMIPKRTF